ncbi:MAG: hypothetical protein D8M61_18945 [Ignavibacteriae bacterium]|nr:hypothetical protein [Ignavibacteriota bacterium]
MKIAAVYIGEQITHISVTDSSPHNNSGFLSVNSIFLFKEPRYFADRLKDLLESKSIFERNSFDLLVFCLNDSFDKNSNKLIHNEDLDYLSYSSSFDGFDFNSNFNEFLKSDGQIKLLSYFEVFSNCDLNFYNSKPTIEPSAVLLLYKDYQCGFISEDGSTEIFDLDLENNKSLSDYLGDEAIFNIVNEPVNKITYEYTERIKYVLGKLILKAHSKEYVFRKIKIIVDGIGIINQNKIELRDFEIESIQPFFTRAMFGISNVLSVPIIVI